MLFILGRLIVFLVWGVGVGLCRIFGIMLIEVVLIELECR